MEGELSRGGEHNTIQREREGNLFEEIIAVNFPNPDPESLKGM